MFSLRLPVRSLIMRGIRTIGSKSAASQPSSRHGGLVFGLYYPSTSLLTRSAMYRSPIARPRAASFVRYRRSSLNHDPNEPVVLSIVSDRKRQFI